jgi:hypothetical protein
MNNQGVRIHVGCPRFQIPHFLKSLIFHSGKVRFEVRELDGRCFHTFAMLRPTK